MGDLLYTVSSLVAFNSLLDVENMYLLILPSKEECNIKGRAVQIDKLKKEHFQSEAVLPLRLSTWLLWEREENRFLARHLPRLVGTGDMLWNRKYIHKPDY